jgi:Flp pilus assembly protein TadG
MKRSPLAFAASTRANAVVEFALLAPSLVLMIAGVSEMGRLFVVYNATNRLATQYAIAWSDCDDSPAGTCSTEMSLYTPQNAIHNIAPQLYSPTPLCSTLTLQMFQISMSGATPNVAYAYPSGTSLSASQSALATATFSSGQSGVVVTATCAYSLGYFTSLMTPFLTGRLTPSYTALQLKS